MWTEGGDSGDRLRGEWIGERDVAMEWPEKDCGDDGEAVGDGIRSSKSMTDCEGEVGGERQDRSSSKSLKPSKAGMSTVGSWGRWPAT